MAKVILDADIQAISGKLDKNKNAAYAYNKKTGKCYRYEYNTDSKHTNTTSQNAVRTAFTTKAKAAASWWKTNKPASDTDTTTAEWTAMLKAYEAQNKYGNPYTFVRSKLKNADSISFTGTTSSTTPSGNSGSSTGYTPSEDEEGSRDGL